MARQPRVEPVLDRHALPARRIRQMLAFAFFSEGKVPGTGVGPCTSANSAARTENTFIGRIQVTSVPPPYTVASLKRAIVQAESLPDLTALYETKDAWKALTVALVFLQSPKEPLTITDDDVEHYLVEPDDFLRFTTGSITVVAKYALRPTPIPPWETQTRTDLPPSQFTLREAPHQST
ncbi:hypothetical protein B0H12DRAFT_1238605 [Mycena haematopus]|nr:hypothetical protein B0H12DRAFT_1238605 [Mycena haematopus]